jgi:hypothetical protein
MWHTRDDDAVWPTHGDSHDRNVDYDWSPRPNGGLEEVHLQISEYQKA